MKYLTTVLASIALFCMIVFGFQNLAAVDVRFLGWTVSMSKFVVILISYLLGMVTGWGLLEMIKRSMKRAA